MANAPQVLERYRQQAGVDSPVVPPCGSSQSQDPLDKQAASRLAGALSTIQLRQGETVAAEGGTVDRCFLIEYGSVEVRTAPGRLARVWLRSRHPRGTRNAFR